MAATRRNFWIHDELYAEMEQAAAEEAILQGAPVSVSAWLRLAVVEKLQRDGELRRENVARKLQLWSS